MTTLAFAMWLQQDSDAAGTHRLVFILVLLIAVAVAGMAIVLVSLALKASKVIKDLTVMADQFKGKLLPLLDEATPPSRAPRKGRIASFPKTASRQEWHLTAIERSAASITSRLFAAHPSASVPSPPTPVHPHGPANARRSCHRRRTRTFRLPAR